jgi:hypothetical protein
VEMLLQSSLPSSVEAALSFTSDHGKRDLTFEWINAETRQCCLTCNELSQDGSELLTANTTFETSGSSYICKRRKLLKNSVVIFPLEAEVNVVPVFAVKNGPSDIQVEDTIDDGTGAPPLSTEKSVFEFNSANSSILNSHKFSKSPCSKFKFSIKPDVNTKSKFVSFGKDLRSDCSLREPDIQVGSVIKTNEANHITESLNHDIQVNVVPVFAVRNSPSGIQVEDTIDDGTGAPLSTEKSVFEFNSANASVLNSHKFSKGPCSKFKFSIKPYVNTKSKSISFGKDLISDCSLREPDIQVGSVIKTNEANHITESLNHDIQGSKASNEEELFLKDLCISVLRSNGLLEPVCPKISCASTDILGIGSDRGYTQSCKQCSLSENILNLLLCDQCEEAFHVSCCKPRLRMLPIDEWFCHSCSKMNCSPSNKNSFSKSCITRSYTASRFGLGPIVHMLKHTEHYTSKVRIGEDFQARVPDWCDQISKYVILLLKICAAIVFLFIYHLFYLFLYLVYSGFM